MFPFLSLILSIVLDIIAHLEHRLVEVVRLVREYVVTCTVNDLEGIRKKQVTMWSFKGESNVITEIKLTMISVCELGLIS